MGNMLENYLVNALQKMEYFPKSANRPSRVRAGEVVLVFCNVL